MKYEISEHDLHNLVGAKILLEVLEFNLGEEKIDKILSNYFRGDYESYCYELSLEGKEPITETDYYFLTLENEIKTIESVKSLID